MGAVAAIHMTLCCGDYPRVTQYQMIHYMTTQTSQFHGMLHRLRDAVPLKIPRSIQTSEDLLMLEAHALTNLKPRVLPSYFATCSCLLRPFCAGPL